MFIFLGTANWQNTIIVVSIFLGENSFVKKGGWGTVVFLVKPFGKKGEGVFTPLPIK